MKTEVDPFCPMDKQMIFIHIEWCITLDCFHFMPKMCFGGFKVAVLNVQYPLPAMSKTHVTYAQVKIIVIQLRNWNALRKHILHKKIAASVLLKLFINPHSWCGCLHYI